MKPLQLPILTQLRRYSIESFLLRGIGVVSLFAMHSTLARHLGTADYGVYSFTLAISGMISSFVPLGFPAVLNRYTNKYITDKKMGLLKGLFARAHQLTFLFSLVAALGTLLIWYRTPSTSHNKTAYAFCSIIIPLLAFTRLRRRGLQAFRLIKTSVIPEEIVLPLAMTTFTITWSIKSYLYALISYCIISTFNFALGTVILTKRLNNYTYNYTPKYETNTWVRVGLLVMLAGIGRILLLRTDTVMIGLLIDNKSIGLYSASQRITSLMVFTLASIEIIASPLLAKVYYEKKYNDFITIIKQSCKWSTCFSGIILILLLCFSTTILKVFGPDFVDASKTTKILALGQFVFAALGITSPALAIIGREKIYSIISISFALLNIIGNVILIPIFGIAGAAGATSTSLSGMIISYTICLLVTIKNMQTCDDSII